jgi:hypothetical protein
MDSRDWADAASACQAGADKAAEYRRAGQDNVLDVVLTAMADRCYQLSRSRAAEEQVTVTVQVTTQSSDRSEDPG